MYRNATDTNKIFNSKSQRQTRHNPYNSVKKVPTLKNVNLLPAKYTHNNLESNRLARLGALGNPSR